MWIQLLNCYVSKGDVMKFLFWYCFKKEEKNQKYILHTREACGPVLPLRCVPQCTCHCYCLTKTYTLCQSCSKTVTQTHTCTFLWSVFLYLSVISLLSGHACKTVWFSNSGIFVLSNNTEILKNKWRLKNK